MARIDNDMMELLRRSDCTQYMETFSNVTKKSLTSLSSRLRKKRLKSLLPATPDGETAAKKIFYECESDSEELETNISIKTEIKTEKVDQQQSESLEATIPVEEDDEEIQFLEEISGDVSVLEVRVKTEQEEDLVEIDEDEDSTIPDEPGGDIEARAPSPDPGHIETLTSTSGNRKRRRKVPRKANSYRYPGNISLVPVESCKYKLLEGHNAHVTLQQNSNHSYSFSKWRDLLRNGARIGVIDCHSWTWSAANAKQGQSNLFHILSNSHQLEELTIHYKCGSRCDFIPSPGTLKLPHLRLLKICHQEEINYRQALTAIIASAPQLEKIELEYRDELDLHVFLDILQVLPATALASVKSLSIKQLYNESVALVKTDLASLANIQAKNLEILYLGLSLWQDTKKPLEQVLQNFFKLKRLTVLGCFKTNEKEEPKTTINIPKMPHLELLSMGKDYKFSTVFESITERPRKRRRTSVLVRTEVDTERLENQIRREPSTGQVETHAEFFPVTLNFTAELPNLKTIELGTLYDIKDLHFTFFPKLQVFQVSSPWHLTVKFPSESTRRPTYPLVTKLQLPDNLKDYTFVQKVVQHFPNIEHCWIYLPTVKVLRAFSKAMLSCSTLKLKELILKLKLQFDFASSLDWAFLDEPSTSRAKGIAISASELKKIRVLKSYELWEQYVDVNNIDMPEVDELISLEN